MPFSGSWLASPPRLSTTVVRSLRVSCMWSSIMWRSMQKSPSAAYRSAKARVSVLSAEAQSRAYSRFMSKSSSDADGGAGRGDRLLRLPLGDGPHHLRRIPPRGLPHDLPFLVVEVEGVALGPERLVGDVEAEEHRGRLRAPLPADQSAAFIAHVGTDP